MSKLPELATLNHAASFPNDTSLDQEVILLSIDDSEIVDGHEPDATGWYKCEDIDKDKGSDEEREDYERGPVFS